jgi:hypothetical protein
VIDNSEFIKGSIKDIDQKNIKTFKDTQDLKNQIKKAISDK